MNGFVNTPQVTYPDLENGLNKKANVSHTHSATDINSGTFNVDRLPIVPTNKGGTGNANGTIAKLTTARTVQTNLLLQRIKIGKTRVMKKS